MVESTKVLPAECISPVVAYGYYGVHLFCDHPWKWTFSFQWFPWSWCHLHACLPPTSQACELEHCCKNVYLHRYCPKSVHGFRIQKSGWMEKIVNILKRARFKKILLLLFSTRLHAHQNFGRFWLREGTKLKLTRLMQKNQSQKTLASLETMIRLVIKLTQVSFLNFMNEK